ncbi:MAG TPA: S8 family serine peptidase, partial [Candidatus Obscuribacterales bacterium]
MLKDFIPKSGLPGLAALLTLGFISGCGTANVVANLMQPPGPAGLAARQPISVLQDVSLANSRDVLVRLKPGSSPDAVARVVKARSISALSLQTGIYKLKLAPGQSLLTSLETLSDSGQVAYAEPNPSFHLPNYSISQTAIQPDDPNYGLQWNIKSAKIDMAWSLVTGNPAITVAVIDSGVDPNHPDLVDSLKPLEDIYNEEKGSDLYRNPISGEVINFGGRDGNGHGTHVTGIIAATMNNGIGVAGVAGGGVKILPIKATDYAGNTDAATLTAAFQRAIDKGANVINISIGGPASKSTQALVDVIKLALQRNIPIISATGNESDRSSDHISPITVPAAYSGVIAVGANTEYDKVASYSNGGPEIDLVAPGGGGRSAALREGQQIWSTWPSYNSFEFYQKRVTSTYYAATSGTSMSCPHVTGVVALMLAREPNLTPAKIRSRL